MIFFERLFAIETLFFSKVLVCGNFNRNFIDQSHGGGFGVVTFVHWSVVGLSIISANERIDVHLIIIDVASATRN